jgi:hypothetical protein
VQFEPDNYGVTEGITSVNITVKRNGPSGNRATVDYSTQDNVARQKGDFEFAAGTLVFEPGETSKTFKVLINDDNYFEESETFLIVLSNPSGVALGAQSGAQVTVSDNNNDLPNPPTSNIIEDAADFIGQQYHDFLNRDPDTGGQAYWTNEITKCGNDAGCVRDRRVAVSAAFFVEQEFQQTGYYVYRFYKAALGRRVGYIEFMTDRSRLQVSGNLDAEKQAYALDFVQRAEFINKYQSATDANSFVDALLKMVKTASDLDLSSKRDELIAEYNAGSSQTDSRARVLRKLIEYKEYTDAEYNRAFVLAQYFGYLRREPDEDGYLFWLNVLNSKEPGNYTGMVCSFITSQEYQERFSSFVPRTNQECKFVPLGK